MSVPDDGSQPRVTYSGTFPVDGAPTGRCRISSARHEAVRFGDVIGRHALGADAGEVAGVAAVVAADHDHQIERLLVEQRDRRRPVAPASRCRSCRRRGSARPAPPRRSDRAWPRGTSRRSPATRSSASSSGWRSRRAADPVGIEARRDRVAEARRGTPPRSPPSADVVAHDRGLVAVEDDEVAAAADTSAPATRWRAFPRAAPCRG